VNLRHSESRDELLHSRLSELEIDLETAEYVNVPHDRLELRLTKIGSTAHPSFLRSTNRAPNTSRPSTPYSQFNHFTQTHSSTRYSISPSPSPSAPKIQLLL